MKRMILIVVAVVLLSGCNYLYHPAFKKVDSPRVIELNDYDIKQVGQILLDNYGTPTINYCSHCGKYNLSKYCSDCGLEDGNKFYAKKKCPQCYDRIHFHNDKFCDNCGKELIWVLENK